MTFFLENFFQILGCIFQDASHKIRYLKVHCVNRYNMYVHNYSNYIIYIQDHFPLYLHLPAETQTKTQTPRWLQPASQSIITTSTLSLSQRANHECIHACF